MCTGMSDTSPRSEFTKTSRGSEGSDLPAGLTELLHVDGAAQGDDEHGQVL